MKIKNFDCKIYILVCIRLGMSQGTRGHFDPEEIWLLDLKVSKLFIVTDQTVL